MAWYAGMYSCIFQPSAHMRRSTWVVKSQANLCQIHANML